MDDQARNGDDGPLSVWLDVHLDRQPISGRLRTEGGAEERFVGWLGFVDALKRLHERQDLPADPTGEHPLGGQSTTEGRPNRQEPQ